MLLLSGGCSESLPEPVAANEKPVVPVGDIKQPVLPVVDPLRCVIRSAPTCRLGKVPSIKVAITNQTRSDITLVGSLDGSGCNGRYPHCYFEIIGPNGENAVMGLGRCGNMNTLCAQDFVVVPGGKAWDPYKPVNNHSFFSSGDLNSLTFGTPGEYRIRFVYSTKNGDIAKWAGDGRTQVAASKELNALFKKVPKLELKSNEIKVTVVEVPR